MSRIILRSCKNIGYIFKTVRFRRCEHHSILIAHYKSNRGETTHASVENERNSRHIIGAIRFKSRARAERLSAALLHWSACFRLASGAARRRVMRASAAAPPRPVRRNGQSVAADPWERLECFLPHRVRQSSRPCVSRTLRLSLDSPPSRPSFTLIAASDLERRADGAVTTRASSCCLRNGERSARNERERRVANDEDEDDEHREENTDETGSSRSCQRSTERRVSNKQRSYHRPPFLSIPSPSLSRRSARARDLNLESRDSTRHA